MLPNAATEGQHSLMGRTSTRTRIGHPFIPTIEVAGGLPFRRPSTVS